MQNRVSIWEAAGFLGLSKEILEKTQGHHHTDHTEAIATFGIQTNFPEERWVAKT